MSPQSFCGYFVNKDLREGALGGLQEPTPDLDCPGQEPLATQGHRAFETWPV